VVRAITTCAECPGFRYRLKVSGLKGLCHGQKCLHLFSDSEAYHEQMGPIPSSNGSLDIALSNVHNQSHRRRTFLTVDTTELASR